MARIIKRLFWSLQKVCFSVNVEVAIDSYNASVLANTTEWILGGFEGHIGSLFGTKFIHAHSPKHVLRGRKLLEQN